VTGRAQPRLAILISGRGSNLQAFIDACATGELNARISIVISNNPDASGLLRAEQAGIPNLCIDHHNYTTREDFDRALVDALHPLEVDLVILAGFMRILTPVLIEPFLGRLMNIHPSLLPNYPGLHTHKRAIEAGDKEAGVTVHFVTQELDGGPPVLQARVPILSEDTPEALAARVATQEHIIYPIAARWFLEGRLALAGAGAILNDKPIAATGIHYNEKLT
jgi:phosphoribosylglycinamide formyltransferase-1